MDISAFRDELVRILEKRAANVKQKAVEVAFKKPLLTVGGLLAAGGAAHHLGETAHSDWKTGRAYRRQMERSRG